MVDLAFSNINTDKVAWQKQVIPIITDDTWLEHEGDRVIFLLYENRRNTDDGWDVYVATIHKPIGVISEAGHLYTTKKYEDAKMWADGLIESRKDDFFTRFWYNISVNEKEYLSVNKQAWQIQPMGPVTVAYASEPTIVEGGRTHEYYAHVEYDGTKFLVHEGNDRGNIATAKFIDKSVAYVQWLHLLGRFTGEYSIEEDHWEDYEDLQSNAWQIQEAKPIKAKDAQVGDIIVVNDILNEEQEYRYTNPATDIVLNIHKGDKGEIVEILPDRVVFSVRFFGHPAFKEVHPDNIYYDGWSIRNTAVDVYKKEDADSIPMARYAWQIQSVEPITAEEAQIGDIIIWKAGQDSYGGHDDATVYVNSGDMGVIVDIPSNEEVDEDFIGWVEFYDKPKLNDIWAETPFVPGYRINKGDVDIYKAEDKEYIPIERYKEASHKLSWRVQEDISAADAWTHIIDWVKGDIAHTFNFKSDTIVKDIKDMIDAANVKGLHVSDVNKLNLDSIFKIYNDIKDLESYRTSSLKFADPLTYTDTSGINDGQPMKDKALMFHTEEATDIDMPVDTMWLEPDPNFNDPSNENTLNKLDRNDNTILENERNRKLTLAWQQQLEPKTYSGKYVSLMGEYYVYVNDKDFLPLEPSLKILNHSPTGFAWGYMGSGPAQLALAMLLDYTGDAVFANKYHQLFKIDIISDLPRDEAWSVNSDEIDTWIHENIIKKQAWQLQKTPEGSIPWRDVKKKIKEKLGFDVEIRRYQTEDDEITYPIYAIVSFSGDQEHIGGIAKEVMINNILLILKEFDPLISGEYKLLSSGSIAFTIEERR